jgi:predicted amidophosphoribosyltransferase
MGVAVVLLLALVATGIVVYPLLPWQAANQPTRAVTDGDIDRVVGDLRKARSRGILLCPACGQGYKAGDRFCVRCGESLPGGEAASTGVVCPSCGVDLHPGDQFCAKCGHHLTTGEAA